MTPPPARPKIYHITHVDNLAAIASAGLVCDSTIAQRGGPMQTIGMSDIKRRRIEELAVYCHPGTMVGDYVPFYFCPRSIMLCVIWKANHPELSYRGGQEPIAHLEADLHTVVQWANTNGIQWAFSLSNAGARYTEFRCDLANLNELVWEHIAAADFRSAEVKEHKQAEFLMYGHFPFALVQRIGVKTGAIQSKAKTAISGSAHQPSIEVRPEWYF